MTTLRRRVLRPARNGVAVDPAVELRRQRRQQQLEKEQQALDRWMGRLRRAFHAVEKSQARVRRLERQVASI